MQIGQFNAMTVAAKTDKGWLLQSRDGEGEALLAAHSAIKTGDVLQVFVYIDGKGRPVATLDKPLATVGEFAWLQVVAVNQTGAFLDWGLPKDLLLPYGEQKFDPEVGKRVMVRVYLDNSGRIVASSRIDSFIEEENQNFKPGQQVEVLVADKTELGFKAIIENSHWGMIYSNEIYSPIAKGQRLSAWVNRIRRDKRIDLILNQPGYNKVSALAELIIDKLEEHDGFLMITDKSPPEVIRSLFKTSKKAYKQAVGALYKQRRIVIEEKGIRLLDN